MRQLSKHKARVLCVDDDAQVLEGLTLLLRQRYDVVTASSGNEALELLQRDASVAAIVSDMQMPAMDGARLLAQARHVAPEAVRVLLTGRADVDAAIAAVNDGQIFRFLTKPCPPSLLVATVTAAVEQHRLVTAERVLLEETLHGSIKAMTDVLALVSPAAFGRATRIKQLVSELADQLGLRERWQVEVAAMLSQLGCITLPPETAERMYYGKPLSSDEQKLVRRLPALTEQLLGNIPRLDEVREILRTYPKPYQEQSTVKRDTPTPAVALGAQLLKVAVDLDALESIHGGATHEVVDVLFVRKDQYDPVVLEALRAIRGRNDTAPEVLELPLVELRSGMTLAEDVKLKSGVLLVARGYEVNDRFLERVRNFAPLLEKNVWRVVVRNASNAVSLALD